MKTRNYRIDVIKGICILLVVLCHTVLFENLPTVLARIANGVFLNLFFMVSGYLAWKPDSEDKNADEVSEDDTLDDEDDFYESDEDYSDEDDSDEDDRQGE